MDDAQILSFFERLTELMQDNIKSTTALSKHNKELKTSEDAIFESIKKGLKPSEKLIEAYKKDLEIKKKYEAELLKLTNTNKKYIQAMGKSVEAINASFGAMSKGISILSRFAGSAAAVGFSFSDLSNTITDYNKNLFDISRIQQVAGRGAMDLSSALKYVDENTLLSSQSFAKLGSSVQSIFIGVKPSMLEISKQLKVWGEQTGYDYDSFKELAQVQAKFPQLADKWGRALDLVGKINEGMGTEEDKKRLEIYKEETIALAQVGQVGSEAMTKILQTTTPLTASQKQLMEIQKGRMEATKEMEKLQLEFSKAFAPVLKSILSTATGLLKTFNEYKGIIITTSGIAVGLKGIHTGFKAIQGVAGFLGVELKTAADMTKVFNARVMASAGLVGLVAAAVVLTVKSVHDVKKAEEELAQTAKDTIKDKERYKSINEDLGKMTKEQKDEYGRLLSQEEKRIRTSEELAELHEQIKSKVKGTTDPVSKLAKEYETAAKNTEVQLAALGNIRGALEADVSVAEEFGLVAKDALKNLIQISEIEYDTSMKRFNASLKTAVEMLKTKMPKLEIDMKGDPSKIINDVLMKSKELKLTDEEREKINNAIVQASADYNDAKTREGKITKSIFSDVESGIRQQEKMTSLYEARLDTERKLMESAQFGLGASVEMMQKQVDLANTMAKTYQDADRKAVNLLTTEGGIVKGKKTANEQDIKALQNAKTQAEAEDYIKNVMKKTGKEASALSNYAADHQKWTKQTMDQQQKIYELTKSIREGYLDALREMSVGAGEFEKIIGTQEMGVTQLMSAVKDATGEFKTNTFKLGGMQGSAATAAGTRTQVTGQMTTGGLKFIGGAEQEARNRGIWQYKSSTSNVAGIKGGAVSTVAPRVGSAVAPQYQDIYAPSQRDAFAQIGGAGYVSPTSTPMSVVNRGVFAGGLNVGETKTIQGGVPAGVLGSNILNMQPPPMPATGGFVPGIGIMPQPSQATVIVKLESGLKGELEQVSNLKVQLDRASR